jgi:polyisoprenoid-binding protein YceI
MTTATKTAIATGTWVTDPVHSTVGFSVKHLGIATVRGKFGEFEGQLEVGDDLSSARISGLAKAASIDTGEPQRDAHLRSPDFFDAEQFPELRFESTRIEQLDDEDYRVTGNLTIHGVTNEVVLHAELEGADTDPWGNERIALEITGKISRGDYDMKFNQALGSGNMLVADKVALLIEVSAVKQS